LRVYGTLLTHYLLASERQIENLGQTCRCVGHDHDLVHELSDRPDAIRRDDQRIAKAV